MNIFSEITSLDWTVFVKLLVLTYSVAFLYSAIIYSFDPFEREPKFLLGVAFWIGGIVLPIVALGINTGVYSLLQNITGEVLFSRRIISIVVAPIVEEGLKVGFLIAIATNKRNNIDSVVDGIVYAVVISLAYAASENALYLYRALNQGGVEALISVASVRLIAGSVTHPVFTSVAGIAIAKAKNKSKFNWKLIGSGYIGAILIHAAHNALTSSNSIYGLPIYMIFDFLSFGVITITLVSALWAEAKWISKHLAFEAKEGLISIAEVEIAASLLGRWTGVAKAKNKRLTRNYYQLLTKLAFNMENLEKGNVTLEEIDSIRKEIRILQKKL